MATITKVKRKTLPTAYLVRIRRKYACFSLKFDSKKEAVLFAKKWEKKYKKLWKNNMCADCNPKPWPPKII